MSQALRNGSILSAVAGLFIGVAAQAQQIPTIPIPAIDAEDLGFRAFNVKEFLRQNGPDRAIDASFTDAQAMPAPRMLDEIDFIFQDQAAGIICEVTLLPIANANRPYPMIDCGVSNDPLAQFRGGEDIPANRYFDDIGHDTELMEYDAQSYSQSVLETIVATKDRFTFSLQRIWTFAQDDTSVCIQGEILMEGIEAPIAHVGLVCNEDVPVSNHLGDIFIAYEEDLSAVLFPDMFLDGPGSY